MKEVCAEVRYPGIRMRAVTDCITTQVAAVRNIIPGESGPATAEDNFEDKRDREPLRHDPRQRCQSSARNPGARLNSFVLWVTKVRFRALACPAINTS
jgi:hypothetical protein